MQKLLDAGAKFVGKTQTAELAFSLDGRNTRLGTPKNPAAPGRVPGGSSSGSAAAVAAGLVDLALGSDTGGSVRAPASMCGIIGLRPTHGRIDISGTMPLAPSLDTVGWFTRDIGLYERVGAVMLGEDQAGPPLARMLHAEDGFAALMSPREAEALAPAVAKAKAAAASVEAVTVAPDGLANWVPVFRTTQGYEAWKAHGPWIIKRKPNLMPAVAARFEAARQVSEAEYKDAAVEARGDPGAGDRAPRRRRGDPPADPADDRAEARRRRGGVRGVPGPGAFDPLHRRARRPAADLAADGDVRRLPARAVADRAGGPRPGADRVRGEGDGGVSLLCLRGGTLPPLIPAQAGIQILKGSRADSSVPACAGTSGSGGMARSAVGGAVSRG